MEAWLRCGVSGEKGEESESEKNGKGIGRRRGREFRN
jgi:hypothetical protein